MNTMERYCAIGVWGYQPIVMNDNREWRPIFCYPETLPSFDNAERAECAKLPYRGEWIEIDQAANHIKALTVELAREKLLATLPEYHDTVWFISLGDKRWRVCLLDKAPVDVTREVALVCGCQYSTNGYLTANDSATTGDDLRDRLGIYVHCRVF